MNVMNLNLKNKPKRSGFDLSRRNIFSCKSAMLLPCCTIDCLPGDTIDIDVNSFTRTAPVETAAYTQFNQTFEWYFVPYRLLWKYFNEAVSQMYDNRQYTVLGGFNETQNGIFPWFTTDEMITALNALPTSWGVYATDMEKESQQNKLTYNTDYQGQNLQMNLLRLLDMLGYGNFYQYINDIYEIGTAEYPYSDEESEEEGLKYNQADQYKDFAIWFALENEWKDDAEVGTQITATIQTGSDADDTTTVALYGTDDSGSTYYPVYNTLTRNKSYTIYGATLSPFPLLAYQKIYQDYYRNSQWEEASPRSYNIDYMFGGIGGSQSEDTLNFLTGTTTAVTYSTTTNTATTGDLPNQMATYEPESEQPKYTGSWWWTLHYKNLPLDPIFGVLPNSQYGSEATVTVDEDTSDFSILDWRKQRAYQKWAEIAESGSQNFSDQLLAHWGVKLRDQDAHLCTYLGGTHGTIKVNEVVNTNLGEDSANIKGKGIGSQNGGHIKYSPKEYGLIMCIHCITPEFVYRTNPLHPETQHYDYGSFAIPEYDKIGMQTQSVGMATTSLPDEPSNENQMELALHYIFDTSLADAETQTAGALYDQTYPIQYQIREIDSAKLDTTNDFGYAPRYINYKAALDEAHGAFLPDNTNYRYDDNIGTIGIGTLENWVIGIDPNKFYTCETTFTESTTYTTYFYGSSTGGVSYQSQIKGGLITANYSLNDTSYETLKYKPNMVDNVFGVATDSMLDTDQFYVDAQFTIKAVRNLDYSGMPE